MTAGDHFRELSKARLAIAGVCALILIGAVAATASWNRGTSTEQRAVLSILPEDPKIVFSRALVELRGSQGRAMPRLLPAVERAARFAPVSASPLFFRSFAGVLQRRPPDVALLEAARQRDPRFSEARLLLLDAYGRNGRVEEAAREGQALLSLTPRNRTLVVRLLAGLAGRDGGALALSRALPASSIRGAVMLRLAQTGADGGTLVKLAQPMHGLAQEPSQRKWIGSLVQTVATRPDAQTARALWAAFYDVDASTVGKRVANPEFSTVEPSPPFDWQLPKTRAGLVEIRDGALQIFYYGDDATTFARQMLMLSPGSYALQSRFQARGEQQPSGLFWRLSCANVRDALVIRSLTDFASGAQAARFVVPDKGCQVQQLDLIGVPTDIARRQEALVRSVTIKPAP